MSLEELKSFNRNAATTEELIELSAFGRSLKAEFGELGAKVPAWIDAKVSAVRREIASRIEADKANRRQQIRAELRNRRSPDEIKADLERELAELGPDKQEEAAPVSA